MNPRDTFIVTTLDESRQIEDRYQAKHGVAVNESDIIRRARPFLYYYLGELNQYVESIGDAEQGHLAVTIVLPERAPVVLRFSILSPIFGGPAIYQPSPVCLVMRAHWAGFAPMWANAEPYFLYTENNDSQMLWGKIMAVAAREYGNYQEMQKKTPEGRTVRPRATPGTLAATSFDRMIEDLIDERLAEHGLIGEA